MQNPSSRSRTDGTKSGKTRNHAYSKAKGNTRKRLETDMLPAILDSLDSQIAVLEESGVVSLTNKAWRDFQTLHVPQTARANVGSNYLELCRGELQANASARAKANLDALELVIHGEHAAASFESTYTVSDGELWFKTQVTRLADETSGKILIQCQDITLQKQVADELRSNRDQLNEILSSVPLIVWTINRDYVVTFLGGAAVKEMGLVPEQLIGTSVFSRLMRDPKLLEYVRRAFEGETLNVQVESGEHVFDTRYAPLRDVGGQVIGVTGISLENTKLARAERELRLSETRWRSLASNAPAIITLLNREGTILDTNRDVYGIPPEQLVGMDAFDYLPPDAKAIVREKLVQVFEKGESGRFEIHSISPAGESIWLEVEFAPIFIDGAVSRAISVATDITRLKKTEAALSASEARWRSIVENVPAVVTMIDAEGTILTLNRNFGPFPPAQLIGRSVMEFIPPAQKERARSSLNRVFHESEPISYELQIPAANGEMQWLRVNMGPVIVDHQVETAVAVTMDITAEKLKSEELQQAHDELEHRVSERTAELSKANAELELFAKQQALLAEENRKLYLTSKRQTEVAEMLYEVAINLGRTPESHLVLEEILVQARRFVPFDAANMMLIDDGVARVVKAVGYEKFGNLNPEQIEFDIYETPLLKRIAEGGLPVIVDDAKSEPDWVRTVEADWVRGYVGVAAQVREEMYGFLNVYSATPHSFAPEHVRLLQALATLGALRLYNVRLYESARFSAQELQALAHSLVEHQESERRRISRELHDEIGQTLTTQLVDLHFIAKHLDHPSAVLERITRMKRATDEMLDEVHRLIRNLHPAALEHLGFVASVQQYVTAFQQQHPELEVTCNVISSVTHRLPIEYEVALFRIVQEALTNVARHAHASRVDVAITNRGERLALVIWDNGIGFLPEQLLHTDRMGILGMQERARMMGANFEIESSPQRGTTIHVEVQYGNQSASG